MEGSGDPVPPTESGPQERSKAPTRIFWGFLAVALLFSIVGISVVGVLGWKDNKTKPLLQVVRLTYKNLQGSPVNQSAITDRKRNTVTYLVTSRNQTSVVLYDSKHGIKNSKSTCPCTELCVVYNTELSPVNDGAIQRVLAILASLVCYKAAGEKSCFLRRMEVRDVENIQSFLNISVPKDGVLLLQNNRTRYYREFLGVLAGRKVNHELVGEPVQHLCDQLPIYWVKKSEGPTRRLIYLCIDICFPNNICVSVCFYYLPD